VNVTRLAATVRHASQQPLDPSRQLTLRHDELRSMAGPAPSTLANQKDRSAGPLHCSGRLSRIPSASVLPAGHESDDAVDNPVAAQ
jgi:hypothetical protein